MADNILRLRVESQEYDAKLKRATEGLRAFTDNAKKSGQSVSAASGDVVNFVKAIGQMDAQAKNAKSELRVITQTLTELTTTYRSLTQQEQSSPFGQAMSQSISQLTERAGTLRDAMMDVNATIQHAASDTRAFDEIAAGVSFATSTFQTFQGAAKLVGIELGDNVEVLAKLQAAMAVTNGLTTIQNALQKQSALMQGLAAVQAKARLAAEALATKGTKAATVAQAAFNAVAKANPYVLLATAVAGVATAMIAFSDKTDEATDAEKRQQDETNRLNAIHQGFSDAMTSKVGESVAEVTSKFASLQVEWSMLKSEAEQKQWIDANQSAFKALGLSVNNVNEAYQVFVKQAPKIIAALKAIAEAEAFKELYKESFKERELVKAGKGGSRDNGYYSTSVSAGDLAPDRSTWGTYGFDQGKDITGAFLGRLRLTESGAAKMNAYYQNEGAKKWQATLTAHDEEVNRFESLWRQKEREAVEAQQGLPFLSGGLGAYRTGGVGGGRVNPSHGGGGGGGGSTEQKTEMDANNEKIKKLELEYINATEESKAEIQSKIKTLQDRNAEIQRLMDEAAGKTAPIGSEKYYKQEIARLEGEKELATTKGGREFFETEIANMQKSLDELLGVKQEMETGFAGTNENSLGAWIQTLQEDLNKAEIGSANYKDIASRIVDVQTLQNVMTEAMRGGLDLSAVSEELFSQMLDGKNIDDSTWQALASIINEKLAEQGLELFSLDTESGNVSREDTKERKKLTETIGEGLQALSSISSGLEQMGIDVPDGINRLISFGQGLLTVIEGVTSIISLFQVTSTNANTFALGANTAAIGGLITAMSVNSFVNAIPLLHNGGVVRGAGGLVAGNSFSGDNVPALLNSGEVVLNRAEAGVIANALDNGSNNFLNLSAKVSAEDIIFVLKNNGRRTGRGEYVTFR